MNNSRRLLNERRAMQEDPPENIRLISPDDDLNEWTVQLLGVEDTVYAGKAFTLRITVTPAYPIEAPEVL